MDTAFVVAGDGTRIAYDVHGRGPALVLLHGGGRTRQSWHEAGYVARLQDAFRVITIDQRGNGESDKPTDAAAYTTEAMGQDVLAVADACGVESFTLWGFSYGANVGRYLAVRSPRVAKLVLIGIPFGPGADGEFRQRILDMRAHWAPLVEGLRNGTLDPSSLSPADQAGMQQWDIPVTLAWMSAILDWPAVTPADLPCPTLWLVGSLNTGAMDSVRAYEHQLEGSQVVVQIEPGLTHMQEFSEIDQVLPALLTFTRAA